MSALNESHSFSVPGGFGGALMAFTNEVLAFFQTVLNPRKAIKQVEQMRALHIEANRIEAAEPARAATLRRRAAQIGLH